MFFHNLEDTSGNIISSKQLELMRFWMNVTGPSNVTGPFTWSIQDFDVLDFTTTSGIMQGINTPVFEETRTPDMETGGLVASILAGFRGIQDNFNLLLGTGLLSLWTTFVGFLDTVFTAVGWANGFSTILSWLSSLMSYLGTSMTSLLQMLETLMSVLTNLVTPLTTLLSHMGVLITNVFTSLLIVFYFISGNTASLGTLAPELVDACESYSQLLGMFPHILVIIGICLPMIELQRMSKHGFGILFDDLNKIIDVTSFLINTTIGIVTFFINLIGRIIESIPVVE